MYLNRDVATPNPIPQPEDSDPVEVNVVFKMHVHSALVIATQICEKLRADGSPYKRNSVDFWCDMVTYLKLIEADIELVEE